MINDPKLGDVDLNYLQKGSIAAYVTYPGFTAHTHTHTHTHTCTHAPTHAHTHTHALLATLIIGRTPVGTARACWLWHSVFGALKEGMLPHEVAQTTMKTVYTFLLIFPRGAGAGTQYYAGG